MSNDTTQLSSESPEHETTNAVEEPPRWSDRAQRIAEIVRPLVGHDPIPPQLMIVARRSGGRLLGKELVADQTIYNWRALYEAGGLDSLARKARSSKNKSRLDPRLVEFVQDQLIDRKQFTIAKVLRL